MLLCKSCHDTSEGPDTYEICSGIPTYGPCETCHRVEVCADCHHLHSAAIAQARDLFLAGDIEAGRQKLREGLKAFGDKDLQPVIDALLAENTVEGVLPDELFRAVKAEGNWKISTDMEEYTRTLAEKTGMTVAEAQARLDEGRARMKAPETNPTKCLHPDLKWREDGWGWCPNCYTMEKQGKKFKYHAVIPPNVWDDLLSAVQQAGSLKILQEFYDVVERLSEQGTESEGARSLGSSKSD